MQVATAAETMMSAAFKAVLAHQLGHVAENCPRDVIYYLRVDEQAPVVLPNLAARDYQRPNPATDSFKVMLYDLARSQPGMYTCCMGVLADAALDVNRKRLSALDARVAETIATINDLRRASLTPVSPTISKKHQGKSKQQPGLNKSFHAIRALEATLEVQKSKREKLEAEITRQMRQALPKHRDDDDDDEQGQNGKRH
jgi:hypothetical protein